jgi:UDP-glucose 4-epimerase
MILVTGGTGYIGSHTILELVEKGYDIIAYDNLSNSSQESLKRVSKITGKNINFIEGDIRDKKTLEYIFENYKIEFVIHFAGLKAVGESTLMPLEYYDNNVYGTLVLLEVMRVNNCKNIVFSSSATVYGNPKTIPINEDSPLSATNPYGQTKLTIELILQDLYKSDNTFNIVILRYFNPVGAHKSGLIGEDPNDIPNNLMPFISQTAIGKREFLNIFGGDYDTHDGTGVRDYIHVVDLANAHLKAIDYLATKTKETKPLVVNIGTGNGYSVLDMIHSFEKASCKKIPYKIVGKRAGDISSCYADPSLAKKFLKWEAKRSIKNMCEDTWRWQINNKNGYNN